MTRTSKAWLAISDCPIVKWGAAESNPRDLSGFAEWLQVYSLRVSDAPTGIVHCAALVSPCKDNWTFKKAKCPSPECT